MKYTPIKDESLDELLFWFSFAVLAAGILICLVLMSGCAAIPKVGECELPPAQHEGYTQQQCFLPKGTRTDACCHYRADDASCDVIICTQDCNTWTVVERMCKEGVE